jgi:8-oxo-dGTP diphosphatase
MFKTQIVVLTVFKEKDKYLLTRRHSPDHTHTHNRWQFAGGGLEYGEHPEQTAIREAKEELGIDITIVKLIPIIKHAFIGKWHGVFISYLCTSKKYDIVLDEEANDFGWFKEQEIWKLSLLDGNKEIMTDIIKAL